MNLIIVESPTKSRTLSRFLGSEYSVEATKGHIKDLPKSKLSIDLENNFEPDYQWMDKKKDAISAIKKAVKKAKTIYIATDPDREGEAIAGHVKEIIDDLKKPSSRIVFHEITKSAVEEAIANPHKVDTNLVDAQVARRVLDRLVGYKLSPLLWKKVRRGLSAGRVQSVAVRLIVDRENEIKAFIPVEYWEIAAELNAKDTKLVVSLVKIADKKAEIHNTEDAQKAVKDLENSDYSVFDLKKREVKKKPYAPFTTSTMTQAGARLYSWSAKRTMSLAQKLYEEGLITYHRTDSTNIADVALKASHEYIVKTFGKEYAPAVSRIYKTNSKSAQEAHEAIRPTDLDAKSQISNSNLDIAEQKLYDLIWRRFVSSQMSDAVYDETTIDVEAKVNDQSNMVYGLRASGQIQRFDGWRKVMPLKVAGEDAVLLPEVNKGEALPLIKVLSDQKFTQPPPRFNEASLIKTLEKLGIGRPSTYAPIITTIQFRGYVEKDEGKFMPTAIGFAANEFLVKNFPEELEYSFTADMEAKLDHVASGKEDWHAMMKTFWKPFNKKLESVEKTADRIKVGVVELDRECPECKEGKLVIRTGRFGKFISCARFPDCRYTEKIVHKINMKCPKCVEGEVVEKKTKKGRKFFGCSRYPDCDFASWKKPGTEDDKPDPSSSDEGDN
jgi:DNA topoisomerase I